MATCSSNIDLLLVSLPEAEPRSKLNPVSKPQGRFSKVKTLKWYSESGRLWNRAATVQVLRAERATSWERGAGPSKTQCEMRCISVCITQCLTKCPHSKYKVYFVTNIWSQMVFLKIPPLLGSPHCPLRKESFSPSFFSGDLDFLDKEIIL